MDIRRVTGDNIRFIRQKLDLSQEALAAKSGISLSYIKYVEKGESYAISIVKLEKIAKVLKVPPGLLMEKGAYLRLKDPAE
jgi:transcriptional regulator with XRE-family HTH domain